MEPAPNPLLDSMAGAPAVGIVVGAVVAVLLEPGPGTGTGAGTVGDAVLLLLLLDSSVDDDDVADAGVEDEVPLLPLLPPPEVAVDSVVDPAVDPVDVPVSPDDVDAPPVELPALLDELDDGVPAELEVSEAPVELEVSDAWEELELSGAAVELLLPEADSDAVVENVGTTVATPVEEAAGAPVPVEPPAVVVTSGAEPGVVTMEPGSCAWQ